MMHQDSGPEKMGETELDAKSREVMEYIIGSLDDDGLLRKDSESISASSQYITTST